MADDLVRRRVSARPRINTREYIDNDCEWWQRSAIMSLAAVESLIGSAPQGECAGQGYCRRRRECDYCGDRLDWESNVLDLVHEATGWRLVGSGHGCEGNPGRPFAHDPAVYRHARHPGVLVVSWSGGIDV